MTQTHDYSEYETLPDKKEVESLEKLARAQIRLEKECAQLEERLTEKRRELRDIKEFQLPDMMDKIGTKVWAGRRGLAIELDEEIRGNIKKENEDKCFAWMEERGHGDMISRRFEIDFDKSEEKWAAKFERDLKKRKKPLDCKITRKIHASTLKAFVRNQLKEGRRFPLKTFGVYRQRFAKVSVSTK